MGKCAVHMMKVKSAAVGGIQSHINREHKSKTNPDIDETKTADNWHIWKCPEMMKVIRSNIKHYAPNTKTVRKDAVMLCSFVVGSDRETMEAMGAEKQRQFFQDAERFFSVRYGAENIIYASIHVDEPGANHMHIGITPIKDGKLCARDLFDRNELKALQTAFWEQVGRFYGLDRGEEDSERKHRSEAVFKAEEQQRKIEELSGTVKALEAKIADKEAEVRELQAEINRMRAERQRRSQGRER